MTDAAIPVESIIGQYYIKYDRLDAMNATYPWTVPDGINNPQVVNIYIDLHDIVKNISGKYLKYRSQFSIAAMILNLVAHYRGYHWFRFNMRTNIYLIYSMDNTSHRYNALFPIGYDRGIKNVPPNMENPVAKAEHQFSLLSTILPYIPGVYYIANGDTFGTTAMSIINQCNASVAHVLITKDKLTFDVPAFNPTRRIALLHPAKYNNQDISYVVTPHNSLLTYFKRCGNKTSGLLAGITTMMWPAFIALNGSKDHNIVQYMTVSNIVKILSKAINDKTIVNAYYNDPKPIYYLFEGKTELDNREFNMRYLAFSLPYQYMVFMSTPQSKDISWQVDLSDYNGVMGIIDQYFKKDNIDIKNLFIGW